MSCSRYHFLLSQNLDGRLPSARREALLDHLAECADCARLDEELRAAQDLALRLPQQRIGPGFQETLWERVRAGEGTPDAVFHDPIPLGKRIRYAAAGAAAAALFLVALNAVTRGTPREPEQVARGEQPAARPTVAAPASEAGGRRSVPSFFTAPERLNSPAVVAQQARIALLQGVQELRVRAPRLRAELRSEPKRVRAEIEKHVQELRGATGLLRWMVDGNFIDLPNDFQTELEVAERGIRRLENATSSDDVNLALEYLSEIRAENLEQRFSIVCCDTLPRFLEQFCDQFVINPDVRLVLRIEMPHREALQLSPGPTNPLEQAWVLTEER